MESWEALRAAAAVRRPEVVDKDPASVPPQWGGPYAVRRPARAGRPVAAVAAIASVVMVLSAGVVIWFGLEPAPVREEPASSDSLLGFDTSKAPAEPGSYVRTRLTATGLLRSDHYIIADAPVEAVAVRIDPPTGYDEIEPVVRGLEVFADGRRVDPGAARLSSGGGVDTIDLETESRVVHLRYVTDGGVVRSTRPGTQRALVVANPLAARVDGPALPALVGLRGTEVLSLSCALGEEVPQPCGRPVGDLGWRVDLEPAGRSPVVLAQVDLPVR